MKQLALLLLAALAPPGGPHTWQFNLDCSGTREINSIALGRKVEPYRTVYRVDLAAKRWCDGECLTTRPISDVQPNALELEPPRRVDGPNRRETFTSSIDRGTGEHRMFSFTESKAVGMLDIMWKGQCEKAPFTGFPVLKTKF